jgi:G:T-mismatch repair DNA endonuclease (very short patch repair protein)
MKKQKRQKRNKSPELTEETLKKLLLEAGFVFVNKKEKSFGKPNSELHKGETLIFPEGSIRGIPVK